MDSKEIQNGNRLIAEFMGATITKRNGEDAIYMFGNAAYPEYFRVTKYNKYDSDWNMLKPVIDKIFTYAIAYPDQVSPIREMKIVVDIQPAWEKVVKFIQWYNQNKP